MGTPGSFAAFSDFPGGRKTIELGHFQVHDDQVGKFALGFADRFLPFSASTTRKTLPFEPGSE